MLGFRLVVGDVDQPVRTRRSQRAAQVAGVGLELTRRPLLDVPHQSLPVPLATEQEEENVEHDRFQGQLGDNVGRWLGGHGPDATGDVLIILVQNDSDETRGPGTPTPREEPRVFEADTPWRKHRKAYNCKLRVRPRRDGDWS